MRAALYLRVSTDGQTVENQRRDLLAVAERHGWEIVTVFADEGVSGATHNRDERPSTCGRSCWLSPARKRSISSRLGTCRGSDVR